MVATDGRTSQHTTNGATPHGGNGSTPGPRHGDVGEELRLLGLALLDRFEPRARSVLAGLRAEAAEAAADDHDGRPSACEWCPVCSAIAVFRGDAPELGGRIAEHGDTLLTVLRALLDRPAEADATSGDAPPRRPAEADATAGDAMPGRPVEAGGC